VLGWALHEAARAPPAPPRPTTPTTCRSEPGWGKRAALSVARKLAREACHTLRKLGDQALAPVVLQPAA